MAKSKCCSGTCLGAVVASCPWKLTRIEDGHKVQTGKTCGLPLCNEHGVEVAPSKWLCPWHNKIYSEGNS